MQMGEQAWRNSLPFQGHRASCPQTQDSTPALRMPSLRPLPPEPRHPEPLGGGFHLTAQPCCCLHLETPTRCRGSLVPWPGHQTGANEGGGQLLVGGDARTSKGATWGASHRSLTSRGWPGVKGGSKRLDPNPVLHWLARTSARLLSASSPWSMQVGLTARL